VDTRNGGLNGRRPLNGQDTCFGRDSDLVGSRRGPALTGHSMNVRMERVLQ
jgi:hypothetical protein